MAPGSRHLWLPVVPRRIAAGPRLLLAVALDGTLPQTLGVHPRTVARWRQVLESEGLLRAGTVDRARLAELRREAHRAAPPGVRLEPAPLPRSLVGAGMSAARKVAAAELCGERAGFRRRRQWVRSCAERAERAAVSPATVRAARRQLERLRVVEVRQVRRGRALLHEVRRNARPRPAADKSAHPHQGFPSVTPGREQPRDHATRIGEIFRGLVGTGENRGVSRIGWRPPAGPEASRRDLTAALGDASRVEALLQNARMSPQAKVAAVLEAAHVYDHAPRRRHRWAHVLTQVGLRPADVVTIAGDVLRDETVRNVAAVLLARMRRAAARQFDAVLSDDGPRHWRAACRSIGSGGDSNSAQSWHTPYVHRDPSSP